MDIKKLKTILLQPFFDDVTLNEICADSVSQSVAMERLLQLVIDKNDAALYSTIVGFCDKQRRLLDMDVDGRFTGGGFRLSRGSSRASCFCWCPHTSWRSVFSSSVAINHLSAGVLGLHSTVESLFRLIIVIDIGGLGPRVSLSP